MKSCWNNSIYFLPTSCKKDKDNSILIDNCVNSAEIILKTTKVSFAVTKILSWILN